MAKKRVKKRTHLGAQNPERVTENNAAKDPKSMVIRIGAGAVGSSVSQLVADVRKVMEPGTAARLKERRNNHLRDYIVMAPALSVSHMLLFSRSESGNTQMRLGLCNRGPTLHFKVESYSLARDVKRAQRRPREEREQLAPPLLVMNNFATPGADANSKVPKHLESLATTVFQSMFPPIQAQRTSLKTIRRILLLDREQDPENEGSFILNWRHYAITTRATGISRPLRKLEKAEKILASKANRKGGVPNLGKLEDISDFITGAENGDGYLTDATSGSELDSDAEIEVKEQRAQKIRKQRAAADEDEAADDDDGVERRAVKLVEIGPRMRLRLTKVEEGLCSGKIMWHEYIHKTKEEVQELERRWEKRRQEKEARRKQQKENVERKKKAKAASGAAAGDDSDVDMEDYDEEFDSEGLAGDAEFKANEEFEDAGEWEEEEDEITNE
ncbi:Brix domain-containing protein C1B9.03c [Colletotrichum chlorophyti]|uniref:Brix domain-containing protein C1B9.03c n=1 Tax=Colletotrichum chlorophyti TaxID=708187 RepID=A0A1Q8RVC9_9PEZI|nr:Brix domain-containing protein C1B9.03c [Colletotrichum chlorophyti]